MVKTYLWQVSNFLHFYHNPAVVAPFEAIFKQELVALNAKIALQDMVFDDVLTGEIVANSEIVGALPIERKFGIR